MGKGMLIRLMVGFCLVLLTACSAKEYQVLTEASSPSINNALFVMGIKWVESYNDIETGAEKTLTSYELLDDDKLILSRRVATDRPELYRALYYLSYFKFQLTDEKGNAHELVRFGNHLYQYENAALYEFKPGTYSLNGFRMRQLQFVDSSHSKDPERWQLVFQQYNEDMGTWELPAGKIVYLGDLTLRFRTKRFMRGLLSPEELNKSITLIGIDIKDQFEQMKSDLKKSKPWFPVEMMVNQTVEKEWIYVKDETKAPQTKDGKPSKKDEKTFY